LTCSKDVFARSKHSLPDLPYDYKALEPIISSEIMELHHSKHHATYVNNLNVAEEKMREAIAKGDVTTQISSSTAAVISIIRSSGAIFRLMVAIQMVISRNKCIKLYWLDSSIHIKYLKYSSIYTATKILFSYIFSIFISIFTKFFLKVCIKLHIEDWDSVRKTYC